MCMGLITYSEPKKELDVNTLFSVFPPKKTSKNNNISKAIEGLSDIINHLLTY